MLLYLAFVVYYSDILNSQIFEENAFFRLLFRVNTRELDAFIARESNKYCFYINFSFKAF